MKLPEGKEECEIEDLFDEKTLGHEDKMVRIFQGDLNLIIVNIMERLVFTIYFTELSKYKFR